MLFRSWLILGGGIGDLNFQKTLEIGGSAGIEMKTYGDGVQNLTWQGILDLPMHAGDFAAAMLHGYWDETLNMIMVELGETERVPLVELARVLVEKGVLRFLLAGCKAAMAMVPLKNRLQHDPGIRRSSGPGGGYPGLSITVVGREADLMNDLNKAALDLSVEDAATKRRNGVEGIALARKGVQQTRTLVWNAAQKALVIQERAALKADELKGLTSEEITTVKLQLLSMHVHENNLSEVQALVNVHKVDVHARNDVGFSPFYTACYCGHLEMADFLLGQPGSHVDVLNAKSSTPLWGASGYNRVDMVRWLLGKGANIDVAAVDGSTSLWIASRQNHVDTVQLLLESGANVNQANRYGQGPLYAACEKAGIKAVKLLLLAKADVHQPSHTGATPLHAACQRGSKDIVEALLEAGADITLTADGDTAEDVARDNGHGHIVELLQKKRAPQQAL